MRFFRGLLKHLAEQNSVKSNSLELAFYTCSKTTEGLWGGTQIMLCVSVVALMTRSHWLPCMECSHDGEMIAAATVCLNPTNPRFSKRRETTHRTSPGALDRAGGRKPPRTPPSIRHIKTANAVRPLIL